LFAHVALLLLPLSLFLGVRAPSRFPSVALGSKLLDVAHCSLLHQLFLLCFGFIGAVVHRQRRYGDAARVNRQES